MKHLSLGLFEITIVHVLKLFLDWKIRSSPSLDWLAWGEQTATHYWLGSS